MPSDYYQYECADFEPGKEVLWYALQLSHKGEQTSPDILQNIIKKICGNAEVVIPGRFNDKESCYRSLMEGYIFVRTNNPAKLSTITRSTMFDSIVTKGGNKLATFTPAEIEKIKKQVRDYFETKFQISDIVYIRGGIFEGLTGEILSEPNKKDEYMVLFRFLSGDLIKPIDGFLIEKYKTTP